jgi:hypothetical protein
VDRVGERWCRLTCFFGGVVVIIYHHCVGSRARLNGSRGFEVVGCRASLGLGAFSRRSRRGCGPGA